MGIRLQWDCMGWILGFGLGIGFGAILMRFIVLFLVGFGLGSYTDQGTAIGTERMGSTWVNLDLNWSMTW